MAEQETLLDESNENEDGAEEAAPVVHWNPYLHGIWKRFIEAAAVDSPYLDQGALNRARSQGEVVGTCRDCGGDLIVEKTQDPQTSGSSIQWTDFLCTDCGKETASPDLRRLHRSSARNKQPHDWWDKRFTSIKARAATKSF